MHAHLFRIEDSSVTVLSHPNHPRVVVFEPASPPHVVLASALRTVLISRKATYVRTYRPTLAQLEASTALLLSNPSLSTPEP